jgi:hypothetical protein
MILLLLAAQTLTVTAPLPDRDGDGRVTLTKAMPPFKRGDVLIQCAPLVYAKVCPVAAPDPWKAAAVERTYPAGTKWVWRNSYPDKPINTTIERVSAVCKTTCVWAGRASTSTIIRDAEFTRAGFAKPGEIDAGIKVGGSKGGVQTAGVLIERVYAHGWLQDTKPGKYANGDGLVVNRGVKDVIVRFSRFDRNADGGVDTKADMTVLDHVSASGNGHYGFRFWGGTRATTLYCTDNAWGCIEASPGADVVIDRVVMKGAQELVTAAKGATVTILSCDLTGWTGTALTKGQGKVTLGEGCKR